MSESKKAKNYDELVYSDDFMFGKVMEDPGLCREVIECLLQHPIGELTTVQTQREFQFTSDGKPIRLDVYNKDNDNVVYDTEMENLNHKSVESHELPRRSRFYQSSIDIDFIDKGESYKNLPDSNVLFICTFDPFGRGRSIYTFKELCKESSEIELKDGTAKVFYNCTYQGDDIPESIREFYDYVITGKTKGKLTQMINEAVEKGRKNEIWRTQYMKELVLLQDAREEGREEKEFEIITNMLQSGMDIKDIVNACKVPFERVKEISDGLKMLEKV
ncbi:MAG: Rpn family recombination-promoting nuclease/putative transposase [Lachnospiraceae bacterium]|nr:Rpn family recombination-promoting nuclease/putative transposase [Lachnospiraceae bacterium]